MAETNIKAGSNFRKKSVAIIISIVASPSKVINKKRNKYWTNLLYLIIFEFF